MAARGSPVFRGAVQTPIPDEREQAVAASEVAPGISVEHSAAAVSVVERGPAEHSAVARLAEQRPEL